MEEPVKRPVKVIYDIVLSFEYPPIPDRSFDWSAVRSNHDPESDPVGWGPTPQAALGDLLELEAERD